MRQEAVALALWSKHCVLTVLHGSLFSELPQLNSKFSSHHFSDIYCFVPGLVAVDSTTSQAN